MFNVVESFAATSGIRAAVRHDEASATCHVLQVRGKSPISDSSGKSSAGMDLRRVDVEAKTEQYAPI